MELGNVLYFLGWAALIFVMMRYGCGAHVLGHGHGRGSHDDGHWTAQDRAVAPVCRMTIATDAAKSALHAGRVYYFCSAECRDQFAAATDSYTSGDSGTGLKERHHGC